MGEQFSRWALGDHLKTVADEVAYLNACLEEDPGDGRLVGSALADIVQARRMNHATRDGHDSFDGLYEALSAEGSLKFGTISRAIRALGMRLQVI